MINAIILEYDLTAANILKAKLFEALSAKLRVLNLFDNVDAAVKFIKTRSVDLVFINVSLKNESGFNLFNFLNSPFSFQVVFLAENKELVLDSLVYRPLDFLIKPISNIHILNIYKRFNNNYHHYNLTSINSKIVFPYDHGFKVEHSNNIIFCQANGNSTKMVRLNNPDIFISKTLKWITNSLNEPTFFRIHKSFFININYVTFFNKTDNTVQLINGEILPISVRKVKEFYFRLSN